MKTKKLLAILTVLVVLCVCLCSCNKNNEPAQDPTESTTNTTVTEEQTVIDIETDGGAVIVGEIGKDENGWYIKPETALNIKYEYFLDDPSEFTNVTRIQMHDDSEDNIDKSAYEGHTVTARGLFSFYRNDFETLYFVPYEITDGKTAEYSYAEPGLTVDELN